MALNIITESPWCSPIPRKVSKSTQFLAIIPNLEHPRQPLVTLFQALAACLCQIQREQGQVQGVRPWCYIGQHLFLPPFLFGHVTYSKSPKPLSVSFLIWHQLHRAAVESKRTVCKQCTPPGPDTAHANHRKQLLGHNSLCCDCNLMWSSHRKHRLPGAMNQDNSASAISCSAQNMYFGGHWTFPLRFSFGRKMPTPHLPKCWPLGSTTPGSYPLPTLGSYSFPERHPPCTAWFKGQWYQEPVPVPQFRPALKRHTDFSTSSWLSRASTESQCIPLPNLAFLPPKITPQNPLSHTSPSQGLFPGILTLDRHLFTISLCRSIRKNRILDLEEKKLKTRMKGGLICSPLSKWQTSYSKVCCLPSSLGFRRDILVSLLAYQTVKFYMQSCWVDTVTQKTSLLSFLYLLTSSDPETSTWSNEGESSDAVIFPSPDT